MDTVYHFRCCDVLSISTFQNVFPQMLRVLLAGGSLLAPLLKGIPLPKVMASSWVGSIQ